MLRYYKVEYFSPTGENMGCAKIACEHRERDMFYVAENNLAATQLFFYAVSYTDNIGLSLDSDFLRACSYTLKEIGGVEYYKEEYMENENVEDDFCDA